MMLLSILFYFIYLLRCTASDQNYVIIHPSRQVAKLGSTITLQCRVKVIDKLDVFWVKDGFGLGNSRTDIRQYGRPINNNFRYDLPFNIKEGEYDLRITDLELSDEGVFYCQVMVDGSGHTSTKVTVQVLVSSEPPILIQRNNQGSGPNEEKSRTYPIIVNDGENLVIDCIAKHGRPGAKLLWFVNDMHIDKDRGGSINGTFSGAISVSTLPSQKNVKLYHVKSTLKMKINSLRHGNWLKCVAENSGFETHPLNPAMSQIEVHTVPIVKLDAHPSRRGNEFTENDVIEFSCSAAGRPNTFSWKWYLRGRQVANIMSSRYSLRINRSMHGSSLKCAAMSTREGYATITLSVKFGPRFQNENTIMYAASVSGSVEMSCKTESNPPSSVTWQRESSKEVLSRGDSLILKNIQDEDFGIYRCTAMVRGFSTIFKNSYLAKKKAPIVQKPAVSYGREGQSARLSCSIEAVPLPNDNEIKWTYNNKVISSSNRHKSYQETFHGGVVTILQILSLNNDDFGDYNCTVTTSQGVSSGTVILLNKGDTPVLMIVGALVIFVFILLVTTVVLCICKRKKYNSDYEKGNPSSPEIPVQHKAKSSLIDSDCHCNPNLYSWIPQTLDLKENRGLLNNIQNQDESLWSEANGMKYPYSNSLAGGHLNSKLVQFNKNEIQRTNPLILNLQNKTIEPLNQYSANFPFTTLTIPRNSNQNLCDQSQCPHYLYQDFCPNLTVQQTANLHSNDVPSPLYLLKSTLGPTKRQFPTDYYPRPAPVTKFRTMNANDNPDEALVSDYASNI